MFVERCPHGFQKPLASHHHVTRQDDGFGIDDRGIVGKAQPQHGSYTSKGLNGHFVAFFATIGNGIDVQLVKFAQHRRLLTLGHFLLGGLQESLVRDVGL